MQLPSAFTERTRNLLGDEYSAFVCSLDDSQPVSIRINPAKMDVVPVGLDSVPWSSCGFYLPERLTFTFDPWFHAGGYYVQEASSMFLEQVIRQYVNDPVRYLDLCAAPGGKTTHALSVLPTGSLVVSNEMIRSRSHILAENVIKWGTAHAVVTNNEPAAFERLQHYFDVILTDVPCSGEGMFRKDAGAIAEWSVDNVVKCAGRQQAILDTVWGALRPGGLLIYSTCTYNTEENEQMLQYLRSCYGAETLPVSVEAEWGIKNALLPDMHAYRFMPHLTRGEGFFMAVLRKPVTEEDEDGCRTSMLLRSKKSARKSGKEKKVPFPADVKNWVREPDDFYFEVDGDRLTAFPSQYADDLLLLKESLNPVHAGIVLGTLKGKDIIPAHSIALSANLNTDAVNCYEVDQLQAIAYLRREAIVLGQDAPRGNLVLVYKGMALGWIKNLGTRANNLYPQEWRIRSGYLPDEVKTLAALGARLPE